MLLNLSPHCVFPCRINTDHHAKRVKTYIENAFPIQLYMFSCGNVLENEFYGMLCTLKNHNIYYVKCIKANLVNDLPIELYMFSCGNVLENEFYSMLCTLKNHSIYYVKCINTYLVNALPIQLYMFSCCNTLENKLYSMLFPLRKIQITYALHIGCKQCLRDYIQFTIKHICLTERKHTHEQGG